jgi:hypothetical protein
MLFECFNRLLSKKNILRKDLRDRIGSPMEKSVFHTELCGMLGIEYLILSVWARALCTRVPVDVAVAVSEAGGSEQFRVYYGRSG